jgi:hypothetical protein
MNKILTSLALSGFIFILTGFNLHNAIVPPEEILSGGPPKDGIPAILKPKLVHPNERLFIDDSDHVIGVKIGQEARAYPIKILNWHEVVNDTINGTPIVVTF